MNVIQDTFRQLVERKLWPIALLLLVALAAVPLLLSKDPEPTSPAPTAAVPAGGPADDAVVSVADAGKRDQVRAVLGDRKDPFRPAQIHHVKQASDSLGGNTGSKAPVSGDGSAGQGAGSSAGSGAGSGGGSSSGGAAPAPATTPAPAATPEPRTYDLYSLKVRFGPADGDLRTREVKRLTGLPGGTQPAALYLGLMRDHKRAVFIIDAGVEVLGDGHCAPTPEDCQTLTLKKGETEFLTRGDKQWELDLVDIRTGKTTDPKAARKSRTAVAPDGRRALRRMRRRARAFSYDAGAGSLKRVARTARSSRSAATFTTSG